MGKYLTVNFFHCINKIVRILEADETKSLGFVCVLISDHLGLHEGGVMAECPSQYFISHIITQITTEYAEITCKYILYACINFAIHIK